MDTIQKAIREGKLQRLVNNVEAQVKEELGQNAEFVLVLVEPKLGIVVGKTVSVLSGVDEDQLPKVLEQCVRCVRSDG